MKYIIDTNVPLKAASTASRDRLDAQCALACLDFISQIMDSGDAVVTLDSAGEIFQAYRNNLRTCGQDTVATIFFNWICRNLTARENGRVEQYPLTVTGDREYAEFPCSPDLAGFDISDRKFIALANAHPEHPEVVEGADSLWWGFRDALKDSGIHICFLCEDYVKTKYEETYHA